MFNLTSYLDELKRNRQPAIASFIMAGYPDLQTSFDVITALEQGGCDLIELGIPFTDPLADGEIIESLHHYGIERGITFGHIMEHLSILLDRLSIPVVLFSYFNLLLRYGIEKSLRELKEVGVSGLIIPDLPNHELQRIHLQDMAPIPMVAPSSTDNRLALAASYDPAFIYCVSSRGVTGPRTLPQTETCAYLERVRRFSERPLALGFGISSSEDIRRFSDAADIFIIGSHLARIMKENISSPPRLASLLEAELCSFKAAARTGGDKP